MATVHLASHCGACLSKEQDIYPHKKTKKNKAPEKTIAFLIFTNERQEVFLKKRPGKGIWGGLWSFVECDDNAEAIDLAIRQHNNSAKIIRRFQNLSITSLTLICGSTQFWLIRLAG